MTLPEPLLWLAARAFSLQRQMNGDMRRNLAALQDGWSFEAVGLILLAAFLYGVFHAVGPGHGKVVIGSYFATRRARIAQGLTAALIAALVQAATAVAVVAALAGLLALAPRDVMAHAAWLEVGSYGLIAVVGLNMGWRTLTDRGCGHEHHDGCCHHGHADDGRSLFAVAAAVGLRPCSGAILVLLFTLGNGMFLVGVAATVAMALGVAITVSVLGLGALGLNRLVERLGGGGLRLRKALALAGAAAITLLGLVLLTGSLMGGTPTLTG
ncbi:MAG: ABC transporter [Magnetospirillum sp.]|nr:ABC transporter [Magnetospirillum sp.]